EPARGQGEKAKTKTAAKANASSSAKTKTASAKSASGESAKVDPKLPTYNAVEGVSGTIKCVGSDSMVNLVTFWSEGFKKFYPNVQTEVEGKGSGTAPPALIAGTATFGSMSREMKPKEVEAFISQFGYEPTNLRTSIDMLGVYVHRDNPIKG